MRARVLFTTVLVAVLATSLAWSQKQNSTFKYSLAQETKITGVIEEVKEFQCPISGGVGAHLVLKSLNEHVTVHLALSKFMKEYGLSFAKGDQVEVTGVKTKIGEEEAILARRVDRRNETFIFRDKKGRPLW